MRPGPIRITINFDHSRCQHLITFVAEPQAHSALYLRIKFANMQMTVFQAIRLPGETFGLTLPLALCSQCGAQLLAASPAPSIAPPISTVNFVNISPQTFSERSP